MRAHEFLTEQELQEFDTKKLKQLAAAGLIGATLAVSPTADTMSSTDKAIPPAQTQQTVNIDSEDEIKDELPKNLKDMSVAEKKKQFFNTIIPLIKRANQEILKDRTKLISIKNQDADSKKDQSWLSKMYSKYKVKDGNIDELLKKVDVIPTSLAASQAAIESGWGTSRFAQEGNALFGQRDYSGGGIKPKGATGFTVAKFNSVLDSIRGYMLNLNTQSSYKQFRNQRVEMRNHGKKLSGTDLAKFLGKYSERGSSYINDVISIIRTNHLE